MNAYSKDLRLRVLNAVDQGLPRREVSRLFGISLSTIKRYLKRRREGKDLSPTPSPGRTPLISEMEQKRALWAQLEANREATLEHHCELWEKEQGEKISVSTMSRAIRKLGWTYKKRVWEPPSEMKRREVPGEIG
jgi:transposase